MQRWLIGAVAVLVQITVVGCGSAPETGKSTLAEMEQTERNHERLVRAVPPPELNTSLERKNLVRRLERLNQEDIISYVYLIDHGKVVAFYPVRGKVSSLNSMLTTPEQVATIHHKGGYHFEKLPSPDFDGSYGKNADGIFFFTTEDAYVEWQGNYIWSDHPLKVTTPPELVYNVTPDKK